MKLSFWKFLFLYCTIETVLSASKYSAAQVQAYEELSLKVLNEIRSRAVRRKIKYPYQYARPQTADERQESLDSDFLKDFERNEIKTGKVRKTSGAVQVYEEIWSWKAESRQARKQEAEKAMHQTVLYRLQGIKERCLERERQGGNKYPHGDNENSQENEDRNFIKRGEPRFADCVPLWREIMSWQQPMQRERQGGKFAPYERVQGQPQAKKRDEYRVEPSFGPIRGRTKGGLLRFGTRATRSSGGASSSSNPIEPPVQNPAPQPPPGLGNPIAGGFSTDSQYEPLEPLLPGLPSSSNFQSVSNFQPDGDDLFDEVTNMFGSEDEIIRAFESHSSSPTASYNTPAQSISSSPSEDRVSINSSNSFSTIDFYILSFAGVSFAFYFFTRIHLHQKNIFTSHEINDHFNIYTEL